jgi:transcriptional regulator with XRE-family HTH domain
MSTREDLIAQLNEKEYREGFVSSQIDMAIPYQVRAMRGKMSQGELAEKTGMKQSRISAIERPGYGNLTLTTLKRLAAAFDVALIVRFAPFSDLVEWSENFSPDTFHVPCYHEDQALFANTISAAVSPKATPDTTHNLLDDYTVTRTTMYRNEPDPLGKFGPAPKSFGEHDSIARFFTGAANNVEARA